MTLAAAIHLGPTEHAAPVPALPLADRVEQIVRDHFEFVWRQARHAGLSQADADDTVQRVMMVAANRACDIEPGKERAFLFRTTMNAVRKVRRGQSRRREVLTEQLPEEPTHLPLPDELLDRRRACAELHLVLSRLPEKSRQVFVLFEIEGWTMTEIGEALELSQGTIASRLRQARGLFLRHATTLQRRLKGGLL